MIRILRWLIFGRWKIDPTCCEPFCFARPSSLCHDGRCRRHCNSDARRLLVDKTGCLCERLKIRKEDAAIIREITGIGERKS